MSARSRQRGLFATQANLYIAALLLLAAVLLHGTLVPMLPWRPDVMLVLVVTWSLLRGLREGLLWAFAGGVLLDLLSGGPFGAFTIALLAAALLAGAVHRAAFHVGLLQMAVVATSTLIYEAVYLTALATTDHAASWSLLARNLGPSLVLNILLFIVLSRPRAWLNRKTAAASLEW